jgi:ribosomal-protein-alanine N-acetyltransferase
MRDLSKTEIKVDENTELVVPKLEQVDDLVKLFQDPENLKFIGQYTDWPYAHNLESKIEQWVTQSKEGTFLFLIILVDSQIAGTCRIPNINPEDKKAALGYILLKEYTRQGLATACIKSLLEFSFSALDLNRIYLEIDSRNNPSIELAKKLNFTYEGTLRQDYKYQNKTTHELSDWQIWSMLKEEYKP